MTYNLFTLSFTGEWEHLEPEFIKSHFRESLTRIRVAVLIAIFFYSIFGFLDAMIVPDQKLMFWIIRYAVICPIALWVLWFSFRPGFETYAQPCLFFMCLSGGLGIELMVILADPPASYSYYAGIILIFITSYTFIRMRFLWAVACSWLIVAGYSMELNIRKRFFSGFKLEQEKNKVSQINRELDQRVRERTLALSTANEHLTKEIRDRINSEKSRIKLEKELNHKHRLEAIGTLAGGIAHDFNNILAADGTIRVYSEPGQGTTFVIYLPMAHADTGPDPEEVFTPPPGTERIMVVDDEETLVHMVQKYLSSLGYTVKGFNNSLEAVAYFSDHPDQFDLILTDFNMPGLTGLELSEKIQGIRKDIPIVLCTGYSKNITREKLRSVGIKTFLMKPVTQYALSTTLRDILDHG